MAKIFQINDSITKFDFSRINAGEFYMNFKIKNREINITRIVETPSYFNENHYELDTIIIINKNHNTIDISKLYDITHNKINLKK